MLINRVYCGDMVQGRKRVKSYKIHILEPVPEEQWFVVENPHEPIIDKKTFEKVQKLLERDTRTVPKKKQLYLFSGFLRCADCGRSVIRTNSRGYVYYFCRTYKQQSKTACTPHTMRHYRLEAAVLYAIQQQVYLAVDYTKTIEQKEREKISCYKQSLYQDWKDGEISHNDYRHMKEDYERKEEALKAVIDKLKAEQEELENGVTTENPFLVAFRQYQNITKLTRDVLIELVDHIKIHEDERISIVFKFADELQRVQEYIELNQHEQAI